MSTPADAVQVFRDLLAAIEANTIAVNRQAALAERLLARLADPALPVAGTVSAEPQPPASAPPPAFALSSEPEPAPGRDLAAERAEFDRLRDLGLSVSGAATRMGLARSTPKRRGWVDSDPQPTGQRDLLHGHTPVADGLRDVVAIDRRALTSLDHGDKDLDARIDAEMDAARVAATRPQRRPATSARL